MSTKEGLYGEQRDVESSVQRVVSWVKDCGTLAPSKRYSGDCCPLPYSLVPYFLVLNPKTLKPNPKGEGYRCQLCR